MRIVLGPFSAPCGALVATNQAQPTVRLEAGVVFGGALSLNVVPRVHFGLLKINKIDAKIGTKIDAEKVLNYYSKIIKEWSHNYL